MRAMTFPAISAPEISKFRRRVLAWFASRKRDLPWRKTSDPYRIWLSEIMLQQTRVAAVIPYYERFIARFPSVETLASARTDAVLEHWAGLGYYSRAKNLHRTAKDIVARHGGSFPREYERVLELPGVGRYTVAAVLSIAYSQPLAVLDGNVARVLVRLGAVRGDPRTPVLRLKLAAMAQALLARDAPGDWNQSMMELGATVCTPKSPRCGECPVASWCRARKLGIAAELPLPRKKRASVRVRLAAAVLLDSRGRTLLLRKTGEEGALFSRMWQFPALEITRNGASELARYIHRTVGSAVHGRLTPLKAARHAVTFRDIRIEPFLVRVAQLPQRDGTRTPVLGRFGRLPISGATRKIARAAMAYWP